MFHPLRFIYVLNNHLRIVPDQLKEPARIPLSCISTTLSCFNCFLGYSFQNGNQVHDSLIFLS